MKIKTSTLWVVLLMMAWGLPASARERVSASISADGTTVYGLTQTHATKTSSPAVSLEVVDLHSQEKTAAYTLPADFFQKAYLFTQGPDTLLVVPQNSQKSDSRKKSKCHVYLPKPHGPPELISGDDFFLRSPLDTPHMWQNNVVLMGEDSSGAHALMFIQEGKPTVFVLDEREEFAAGIQGVRYSTQGWMGYIEVRLYNNQTFHLSPFLTSAGVPLIAQAKRSIGSLEDNTLLRFTQEYYGDNKVLVIERQSNTSTKLFAVSFRNARSMRPTSKTPLEAEPLYHARVFGQDRRMQWVLGYSDVNPKKASVIGYVYDRQSESLTKLPSFDNMDLSRIRSVLSFSPSRLIFEIDPLDKSDALMVHWDTLGKSTFLYASALDFSDKPAPITDNIKNTNKNVNVLEDAIRNMLSGAQKNASEDPRTAALRSAIYIRTLLGVVILGVTAVLLRLVLRRSKKKADTSPAFPFAPPSGASMHLPQPEKSYKALWWLAGLLLFAGLFLSMRKTTPPGAEPKAIQAPAPALPVAEPNPPVIPPSVEAPSSEEYTAQQEPPPGETSTPQAPPSEEPPA